MLKEERRSAMEKLVREKQNVSMEELCAAFDVSINTVRADVAELVRRGAARKVYGGVQSTTVKPVMLFSVRAQEEPQLKKAIARAASSMIRSGDIVFADAGTTTMHLLDGVPEEAEFTLITANVYLIMAAAERSNIHLVVLPGTLQRRTNSLSDGGTAAYLSGFQCTKAFLGVNGITPNGKLSTSGYTEQEIKQQAIRQSADVYLLADSRKFGESNLLSFGTLDQLSGLFTDSGIPAEYRAYCEARHIPVHTVS